MGSVNIVSHIRWEAHPELAEPVMICAFDGWNDAGDAATSTIDHLLTVWGADALATIDSEEFYDFTSTRPIVEIAEGERRTVLWPDTAIHFARVEGAPDVILLRGHEPQLKWKTFSAQILDVARRHNCRLVLTLGALLADVPHSRPTSVFGTAYDQTVIDALGLEPSRYEGPTGIVGVLHDECRRAGLNSASLWAAVPSYVPAAPSPKAALALVNRVGQLLKMSIDPGDLPAISHDYEEQISDLVSEDADTAAYVNQLEERHDSDTAALDSADGLVAEVEEFLREQ